MNKYYELLLKIIKEGEIQINKKGEIKYLLNQTLNLNVDDLNLIFDEHRIAKTKLADELQLYIKGETRISKYIEKGIIWWNYCMPNLINSYPTYYKNLGILIDKINKEKRNSKNYILYIGANNVKTNQLPCLSLIQFQISNNKLFITIYQRSADSNLGLPSDIYQTYLISKLIDIELENITFFIGNAHIYSNNLNKTKDLLNGNKPKFEFNV